MAFDSTMCQMFNDYLGRRPYDWEKKISRDRKPIAYIYTGMYKTETFPLQMGVTHLHERTYVTRPNDSNLWPQFTNDACVGAPCATPRRYVAHGVDQLRYDRYRMDYQTPVFCIDQLNTIEEAVQKLASIAEGYQELPELISSDFLRTLTLRKAGTAAQGAGLYLCGPQDSSGNPVAIDILDNMFAVSQGESLVKSRNTLLINLNANGALTTLGYQTTALLTAAMGKLTMEFLNNMQEDLAAVGYHDHEWLVEGKFSITVDATTRRNLLVANPALTQMYSAADFAKGGAFYSYGVTAGCGDFLFKPDPGQMRFRWRADMDGKNFAGSALTNAVWIEQVQTYENVSATFGLKPVYSQAWKQAPIRLYHIYNRDARTIFVGDIGSVNSEMKFGLARSFMGKWTWHSPDYFTAVDPNSGQSCTFQNDKKNMGYWLGEFDYAEKTVYPEIERLILAVGEPQPYVRVPRTNTAATGPTSSSDYQSILSYASLCVDGYVNPTFIFPPED